MLIGLLGGSFDPVHNGHLIAAQIAREALELDLVLMTPAARQPLKPGHGAPAADRLRMLELAVTGLEGIESDGREIDRGEVSYTVDTLAELARERPGAGLVLLLGSDAAARFDQWRAPEEIHRLARVVVFQRGNDPVPAGFEQVRLPILEISSTLIRERVSRGRSIRGWVPDRVADYISGLALYRTKGGAG